MANLNELTHVSVTGIHKRVMTHRLLTGAGSGPAKRRRDPRDTRERLVRAALELFTSQGYHPSTTPQIARRAGVAEGTIYRHFASKSHLLNEIYRAAVDLFRRAVEESNGPDRTCRERTTEIARRWVGIAATNPGLVKLVFVSPPTADIDPKSRTAATELRSTVESVFATGKAAGEVRPGPVELWTDVWWHLVRLALERVANGTWSLEQSASGEVLASAWDAVKSSSSV
jgi:AcrR family transcriptional regulator